MGVFVFLVPVLLVVVLGYAVGYTVWEAAGLGGNPEPVGWLTGLALLTVVSWLLLLPRRAWLPRRTPPQYAPALRSTARIVRRRMARSSPSDQLST